MHVFLSFEWKYEEAKASNRQPTHLNKNKHLEEIFDECFLTR